VVICRAFLAIIGSSYTIFSHSPTPTLSTLNKKQVISATIGNGIDEIVLHILPFINSKNLMKISQVGGSF